MRGKTKKILFTLCLAISILISNIQAGTSSDRGDGTYSNPVIFADVPDVAVLRDGSNYYMASTTMHMSPGVPIMKSTDLVNWEIVNYVYDRIAENNEANLNGGKNMYGKGSWAASLKKNGNTYYCTFMSYTTGKTYIYQTQNIENGPWTKYELSATYHDMSILFDSDGRVYLFYGGTRISYIELNAEATAVKQGGASGILFDGSSLVGQSLFEGTQAMKYNDYYYVFNIAWPNGAPRTEYCSRSKSIKGPWEHKIVLQTNFHGAGVAQGGIVDTPDGRWFAMMFKDNGPVGRSPVLSPVTWKDGWPILGNDGKGVSDTYPIPIPGAQKKSIVYSDEFDGRAGKLRSTGLAHMWQWNHNPDDRFWSLKARDGFLRLTTGMTTNQLNTAKNTLTTRTYGPKSSATTVVDVSHMQDGDVAGLTAFAYNYGYVGVKVNWGQKNIVMVNAPNSKENQIASVPLNNAQNVYLRVDCDFSGSNKADFYYSLDGSKWEKIGNQLNMVYELTHFMGYRFGLFNFATQKTGGYVDFDYFHVSP